MSEGGSVRPRASRLARTWELGVAGRAGVVLGPHEKGVGVRERKWRGDCLDA